MADTALGATAALATRAVIPRVSDESPGMFDASALVGLGQMILNPELGTEIPAGGFVSTGADVFRFAEAMRLGGAWNGKRVLSKPMVELATSNHTGARPNDLWTYARAERLAAVPSQSGTWLFLPRRGPAADLFRPPVHARHVWRNGRGHDKLLGRSGAQHDDGVPDYRLP
jgi:hypothetical protein